jgi:signal transduction histidine kinase
MYPALMFALGAVAGGVFAASLLAVLYRRRSVRERASELRLRRAERLAEIGAMTRGLAHEIKNPLSTISLNAQLLEEAIGDADGLDPETGDRLARRSGALRREAERLGDILADFLSFAGEVRLTVRTQDVNTVVDELADFYAPQAQHHGVRLRVELAPRPLLAPIDADHVKQALLNLLINATQAMALQDESERTGPRELMIRTAPAELPEGGDACAVHVIDTGPGMSDEVRKNLFTPYYTTKAGGSGLGLPTTKRLIEEHGGMIAVHSEEGRGTDFMVLLPAGEEAKKPAADPVSAPAGKPA